MARMSVIRHEIVVGWFIMAALIIGGVSALFSARLGTHSVQFTIEHGRGLQVGSHVLIHGIRVGEVSKMTLRPDDQVEVHCKINDPFHKNIHADAVATVIAPPLLGDSKVEITPGTAATGQAKDRQVLETRKEKGFLDQLANVEGRVNVVIKRVDTFVDSAVQTLDEFRKLVDRIDKSKGLAGQIIHDEQLAKDTRATIASVRSMAKTIEKDGVPKAIETLDRSRELVEELQREDGRLMTLLRDADKAVLAYNKALEKADVAKTAKTLRETATSFTAASRAITKAAGEVPAMSKDLRETLKALKKASEEFATLSRQLERQPSSVIFGRTPARSPGLRR